MVVFEQDASLDAKRRKRERAKAKVRKNKNASAAAATAAAAGKVEAVAAKGSLPSEDGTKGEIAPTSESARDRAARMPAAGEKTINGSVGEAIARQGTATAVARVTTSPLPNGTAVGAGAGSRTASRSRGGVGKNPLKADRFPTTRGWRTAERSALVGDEDGFITTEKLKGGPRRLRTGERDLGVPVTWTTAAAALGRTEAAYGVVVVASISTVDEERRGRGGRGAGEARR